MHLLRRPSPVAVVLCALLACGARGPLTPQEAFRSLAGSYARRDAEAVMKLMSRPSIRAIDEIVSRLKEMEPAQRASLAEHIGVSPERLGSLSNKDYIALQMELGALHGNDPLRGVRSQRIAGTRVEGAKATVRLENGMELDFVKEGPYWRFDASEW